MSTMALVQGPHGIVAAWETDGQIYFAHNTSGTTTFSDPEIVPGESAGRKHPAVAINARGEMLIAWTAGTGWQKGGALEWQLWDQHGKPTDSSGRTDRGIPVWGLPAVVPTEQGFTIIH